jgi:hypothetical protein
LQIQKAKSQFPLLGEVAIVRLPSEVQAPVQLLIVRRNLQLR